MHEWKRFGLLALIVVLAPLGAANGTEISRKPALAPAEEIVTPPCKSLRWSGADARELMKMQFAETDRSKLIQIAWGESLADPVKSVAGPAFYYLYSTEEHQGLKTYFRSLADQLGSGKFTMRGIVARYPIRKGNSKVNDSLETLCRNYTAAAKGPSTVIVTDYSGAPAR